MGKFFKYLLASFVGCFLALFIIFMLMVGMVGALSSVATSFGDKPVTVKANSVLRIDLNNIVVEQASEGLNFISGQPQTMGLNRILDALKRAKDDPHIKGIYLNPAIIPAGLSMVEEIRAALDDFKKSGKFIIAYSDFYTQKSYYLATVAERIYSSPLGNFSWRGMSSETPFLKHTLEKLDIDMQVIRHGKFKSAVEPLILDRMSAENREQTQSYVNAVWNEVVATVATSRNISVDKLNAMANGLKVTDAGSALANGLLDKLLYSDDVLGELATKSGVKSADDVEFISLGKYIKYCKNNRPLQTVSKPRIAVIYAEGDIVMGSGVVRGRITSEGLSEAIRDARQDTAVKAIVLRINSGGGSALASDVICHEAQLATNAKPFIVSMSDVAASGGYYIAAPAAVIVADRTTITGSIGVFGVVPNFERFMDKKLGINFERVMSNSHADYPNVMRPLSNEERDVLQRNIESIYDTFLTRVSDGRKIEKTAVDEIGQGRVWSAVDAKRIGLIDEFGGISDAIHIAAERAGIDDYYVKELPRQPGMLETLMSAFGEEMRTRALRAELGDAYRYYRQLQVIKDMTGAQARLPFDIEIK